MIMKVLVGVHIACVDDMVGVDYVFQEAAEVSEIKK